MTRSVQIDGRNYEFRIGMKVFINWGKRHGISYAQMSQGFPLGMDGVVELFADGYNDANGKKGKKTYLTYDMALDLIDEHPDVFMDIQTEVMEAVKDVTEAMVGKQDDEPGKSTPPGN